MGNSAALPPGSGFAVLLTICLSLLWTPGLTISASQPTALVENSNSTVATTPADAGAAKFDESSRAANHTNAHSLIKPSSASTVNSTDDEPPATARRRFILRAGAASTTASYTHLNNRSRKRHSSYSTQDAAAATPVLEYGQKLLSTGRNSLNELKSTLPSLSTESSSSTTPRPNGNKSNESSATLPPLASSTASKHPFSAKITPQTTPPSRAQSSESYNDIVSLRRRRKKILRRMPSVSSAEVIAGTNSSDSAAMNAALVRRKTLLQPQRNGTLQNSVVRRPLLRPPSPPPPLEPKINTTNDEEDVIRKMLTTFLPSNNNYTTSTRVMTLESISNGTIIQNNNATVAATEFPLVETLAPNRNKSIPAIPAATESTKIVKNQTSSPVNVILTTTRTSTPPPQTSTTTPKTTTTTRRPPTTTTTTRSTTTPAATTTTTKATTTTTTRRPPKTDLPTIRPLVNATTIRPPILGSTFNTVDQGNQTESSASLVTYVLFSLGVVTLIGAVSYAARHLAKRRRRMLDESDSSCSEDSSMAGMTLSRPSPKGGEGGILSRIQQVWPTEKGPLAAAPAQHPEWHFPRHKLRLQTVLGQGNFGQVWKAEAEDICGITGTRLVAVKSTKAGAGEREKSDLLRELAIMQQLGAHPNVVTLLGCCTEQEPHLLIMEYVMYGKLLSFLRDHRTRRDFLQFSSSDDGGEQALTSWDLTHFAYCIAKGMEYLVSRGIIHRDLAARNILVDHNKQCKIADFGMSRHARDASGEVYEPKQKGALPIRWMAPESLEKSIFTHRSDVWSFGITMWEIVTLGSTPYSTMGAREVMRKVREGYRLERPLHCRPELFRVVASCWVSDPYLRPDFSQLRVELRRLQDEDTDSPGGGHVDIDAANPQQPPPSSASTLMANHVLSDPGGM
ncbi:tyrosine kinase receptor Cad96Ca-like [Cloeon dipterum]|uniref:tyrosine kinase receptor Cad96Ca-like n=1 Tax=Cloeon dipterum TaxID=197152 RepID=UPI0032207A19